MATIDEMFKKLGCSELDGSTTNAKKEALESLPEIGKQVYETLRAGNNVFLTGAGGTGKSHIVRNIIPLFENTIVLGTTGIAASNIMGQTIHSFFKFGVSNSVKEMHLHDEMCIEKKAKARGGDRNWAYSSHFYELRHNLPYANLIIIDEISMASKELINMIFDRLAQFSKRRIPILVVGDFLQLPPVKTKDYAFLSPHWETFTPFLLTENKRTSEPELQYVLNKIRKGLYTPRVKQFILDHLVEDEFPDKSFRVFPTRAKVDALNRKKLSENDNPAYKYLMEVNDDTRATPKQISDFVKDLLVDDTLILKKGCRVMFACNSPRGSDGVSYVNGDTGIVEELNSNEVVVRKDSGGALVTLGTSEFVQYKIEEHNGKLKMIPYIIVYQIPLLLAEATTIHKSQGLSLNEIAIDCHNIFETSQFYVAISRATNSAGIYIKNFSKAVIKVDKTVLDFYEKLESVSKLNCEKGDNDNQTQE